MKMKRSLWLITVVFLIFLLGACSKHEDSNKIKAPASADDFKNEQFNDVQKRFEKSGFKDIEFEKIDDLITGWLTKDGEVDKVSIDGVTDFSNGDSFNKDAKVLITYHTFPEKDSTSATDEEQSLPLLLNVPKEVTANENGEAIIEGTTSPNAEIKIGWGIIGDSTTADKDGKFKLTTSNNLSTDTEIEISGSLDGQSNSVKVKIKANEKIKATIQSEEAAEKEKQTEDDEKRIEEETKKEEKEKNITVDNNSEFAEILSSPGNFELYKAFSEKYAGYKVEFDGTVADISKHDNYKTRYDFLLYYLSSNPNAAIGTGFQFKDKNASYDLHLTGDNVPDTISVGLKLHIIATVESYDETTSTILLEPVETKVID